MAGLRCDGRGGLRGLIRCSSSVGVAMADVRQEIENVVRDGHKDCLGAKDNLVYRYTIEQE